MSVDLRCYPFLGRHACNELKCAEVGGFIGKTRLQIDGGNLLLRLVAHQLFGVLDTEAIDVEGERTALGLVDAIGDISAVDAKLCSHVDYFQIAPEIELLAFDELLDTLHQRGVWLGLGGNRLLLYGELLFYGGADGDVLLPEDDKQIDE